MTKKSCSLDFFFFFVQREVLCPLQSCSNLTSKTRENTKCEVRNVCFCRSSPAHASSGRSASRDVEWWRLEVEEQRGTPWKRQSLFSHQFYSCCINRVMRRAYLDVSLEIQSDFYSCGQHLQLPFPPAHIAHPHLCGVDGGVQVLWCSEARHVQPLWDGGVFHHSYMLKHKNDKGENMFLLSNQH